MDIEKFDKAYDRIIISEYEKKLIEFMGVSEFCVFAQLIAKKATWGSIGLLSDSDFKRNLLKTMGFCDTPDYREEENADNN